MKLTFGILFIIAIISLTGFGLGIYSAYTNPKHNFISFILAATAIITMIGFGLGLYTTYKAHRQLGSIDQLNLRLEANQSLITALNRGLPRQLLFIHHSVGQIWLDQGRLAEGLAGNGIGVHDATYGDAIGEDTDINHWTGKFMNQMNEIIKFDYHPDTYYEDNSENDIIMFKSCFPNSDIAAEGSAPGNPTDPVKTVWNYRAVFSELSNSFGKYPNKKFIYITAPPLAAGSTTPENAGRAREFNNWIKNEFVNEYKSKTGLNNFLVFDLFDVLADDRNFLKKEFSINEIDSHPNTVGMKSATEQFIRMLKAQGIIGDTSAN